MSIDLEAFADLSFVEEGLDQWERQQLPFAAARTLTAIAQDVAVAKHKEFPLIFKTRNKKLKKTINFLRAKKKDWPLQESSLFIRDEFMVLHELGGVKRPVMGAKHLAIPMKPVVRTKAGRIKAVHKPKSILSKKTGSIAPDQKGNQVIRRKVSARNPLGMFFLLRSSARIEARLGLHEAAVDYMSRNYDRIFLRELAVAVKPGKGHG